MQPDRPSLVAYHHNADLPAAIQREIEAAERTLAERLEGAPRKVLLIGGSGYIGGIVTLELLRAGYHVRNLDLNLYGNQSVPLAYLSHPAYEFVLGDMGRPEDLRPALAGVTDVVLLAGLVGDPITKKYPNASGLINETGVRAALDQLSGRGLNNVIFVSTCSNYGLIEGNEMADEDFALNPLSLYAKAKVAAEMHLLAKHGQVEYSPTILRFATAFGLAPRMRFDLSVNEFTRELCAGNELLVYDAHTWRPYCHVKDFARLIRRVLELPNERTAFEVFNAGGDINNHTKQSIVDAILERLPGRAVRYQEKGADPRNYRVSFAKVRERLLFEPKYTVEHGIDEIIAAMNRGFFSDVDARKRFYGNYELTYP